ncbi:HAD-IA family hydrolase [Rubrimonas cliftonensis]|uniref:Haloacid dehalogenase superfamily, subfamily IA, variant 3 with third motif having DD or ED n=1 Tax=Rubrimonas cliftonensis TaxID=89524 RepID=A0A1H4BS37_9RHOB|nr:haloacid dehalogenase superfamily, subfamily IA, variant 3 with third motif having DD or ED [Rubrimonas cliftonensis]
MLVDSEPIALRVLSEALAEAGVAMTADAAQARFLGRSLAALCEELRRDFGLDPDPAWLERMRERLHAAFRAELRPIAGVAAALDALEAPYCVASSSQPERIALSLELTGLAARFGGRCGGRMFSATMVARGKPAPDLFLHAAAAMGAAPAACAVIEDSPAGVMAARAAGMRALGFLGGGHARAPAHRHALAAAGAHLLFDEMARLPGLLASPA